MTSINFFTQCKYMILISNPRYYVIFAISFGWRQRKMKTKWPKITNWIINSKPRRWWAWCELSKCLKLWHFDLVCRRHQCTLDVRHVMRMRVESFLNSKSADELSRECLKLKLIWSHSTTFSSLSFRVRSNTNFSKFERSKIKIYNS